MNRIYCPCPKCSQLRTRVVCTKRDETGISIRRRHCLACDYRWYTMQYPEVEIENSEVKWIGRNGCKVKFISAA